MRLPSIAVVLVPPGVAKEDKFNWGTEAEEVEAAAC